jgi:uncharacterized protein YbbK (DUF523 family)
VRYDGRAKTSDSGLLARWRAEGRLVVVCPEVAGGLPVPRPPAEIHHIEARPPATVPRLGAGKRSLPIAAVVRTEAGEDVTEFFARGAEAALATARRHGVRLAILKEGSPSCGSSRVYDGTFSGTSVPGMGLTAELLTRSGVRVFSEEEIEEAGDYLRRLEAS